MIFESLAGRSFGGGKARLAALIESGGQRVALAVDVAAAAQPETGQERQGRTPALHGILPEHREGESREHGEGGMERHAQQYAEEAEDSGAPLQRLLLVDLALELAQPRRAMGGRSTPAHLAEAGEQGLQHGRSPEQEAAALSSAWVAVGLMCAAERCGALPHPSFETPPMAAPQDEDFDI